MSDAYVFFLLVHRCRTTGNSNEMTAAGTSDLELKLKGYNANIISIRITRLRQSVRLRLPRLERMKIEENLSTLVSFCVDDLLPSAAGS